MNMTDPAQKRYLRAIAGIMLMASLYVGVSLLWIARPWGNPFPEYVERVEYAVLVLTTIVVTGFVLPRKSMFLGVAFAIAGYWLGLIAVLVLIKGLWPNTVMGCIEDLFEWYCQGPLPVVTEGLPAFRVAAQKVARGLLYAVPGAAAVRLFQHLKGLSGNRVH